MSEPIPCIACPKCHADSVIALRTAQLRNLCHCSNCGYVWNDDHPQAPPVGSVTLRAKPDRRRIANGR